MTLHVPRLPLSLDPLLAELIRRTRRRRLLVAAVLVLAVGGAAAGVIEARSPAGANGKIAVRRSPGAIRSCGILGVGIGWHVSASSTMSCGSGIGLMRAYFHGSLLADRTVLGYACTSHRVGGRVSCTRGENQVIANANH
jgi:hypothetical protein